MNKTGKPDYLPSGYDRIAVADSVEALLAARFNGLAVNCYLHPRPLPPEGDFDALALHLGKDHENANSLHLGMPELKSQYAVLQGSMRTAADCIINDMEILLAGGAGPHLRILFHKTGYMREVRLFHADNGGFPERGRIACCYNESVTEGLRNDQAVKAEERPSVQAKVESGWRDGRVYIHSDHTSHTYFPAKHAQIFSFAPGDVWLQTTSANAPVPPFLHRAPAGFRRTASGVVIPRLLMIADF